MPKFTAYNKPVLTQIRWFPLDNPAAATRVEVPPFCHYALLPSGTHLAFKETDRNGNFYLLNLRDQSLTLLDYREPVQEFLNDDHTHRAGSLLWPPDGAWLVVYGAWTETEQDGSRAC